MEAHLRPDDLTTFWTAIDEQCRPLALGRH
jgi:hypothetical protein